MGEEWVAIDLCQHCDAIKYSWVKDELYLDRWWGGQHHSYHLIESWRLHTLVQPQLF